MIRMIEETDHSWGRVELRHLAALEAIAQSGSFRAAARRLGYSQSAVSGQLAALERLIGQRLVERSGGRRAVSLTPAGTLLLEHARQIADRFGAARSDLEALRAARPRLRLGTYQSVAVRLLPGILRHLATASTPVTVEVVERPDDKALLDLVERGEVDATFAVLPLTRGPFAHRELMEDPYRLLVAADSRLAHRRSVDIGEVREQGLIDYRDVRLVHHTLPKLPPHQRPRIVARSDDNTTIHALVAAGVGNAVLPQLSIDPYNPHVRSLRVEPPIGPRRIALAWHHDRRIAHLDDLLAAAAAAIDSL